MSRTRLFSCATILAACVVLTGCQSPEPPTAPSDDAPAAPAYVVASEPGGVAPCVRDGDTVLNFGGSPLPTEAITFGEGERAVILAHQAGQRPCAWNDYGRELAVQGYRVFIPALTGTHDAIMGAAVAWLLAEGVTSYAMVGASMGGTFALAAAPSLDPAPSLIVALSSPAVYNDADALAVIGELDVSVLLMVGDGDGQFPADAQQLADAQRDAELLVVPSGAHGILLRDTNADVAARLDAAISSALG